MPINSFLYPGPTNSNPYAVDNSCRFDGSSDNYMHKTPGSAGNRRTLTISAWVKRSDPGNHRVIAAAGASGGTARDMLLFESSDKIQFSRYDSSYIYQLNSNALYRDPSAWLHIVGQIDTTQSTASDRVKLYVNGVQITSLAVENYPDQNFDTDWNSTQQIRIGADSNGDAEYNGNMCEVCMIDGSALAPTSFGEFNEDSPTIWQPKDVSGLTFGTNGFYLDFEDSGTLGNDANGGTDFTLVNLDATHQSTDTCTNNFATMNSIENTAASTFSEGNLQVLTHSGNFSYNISTIGVPAGKWYCEIKCTAQSSDENKFKVGIAGKPTASTSDFLGEDTATDDTISYNGTDGDYQKAGSEVSYGDSYTTNDILGIALDVDNSKLYFSKNGTWQNSGDPTSGATGTGAIATGSPSTGFWHFAVGDVDNNDTYTYQINFGNPVHSISSGNSDANGYGNFEYAVPSGYYALNTKNLAEFGG